MKRKLLVLAFFLPLLFISMSLSQESRHFYNVDSEKKIEGRIQEIKMRKGFLGFTEGSHVSRSIFACSRVAVVSRTVSVILSTAS